MVCVRAFFLSRSSPHAQLALCARLAFASVHQNYAKNYACSAGYASRGYSSMSCIKKKHLKKHASAVKPKDASCSGECCRLGGYSFEVRKDDRIHNFVNFPAIISLISHWETVQTTNQSPEQTNIETYFYYLFLLYCLGVQFKFCTKSANKESIVSASLWLFLSLWNTPRALRRQVFFSTQRIRQKSCGNIYEQTYHC